MIPPGLYKNVFYIQYNVRHISIYYFDACECNILQVECNNFLTLTYKLNEKTNK
ncbi:hypothetical protein [Pseudomonas phage vB_Pa-PAC2]|nr:hypothetical protein ETTORE_0279 [Pseudomonas phage Ettore]WPK40509.1 hypothetical protein Paride_0279 [Pseudomonas phage Paride]